MFPMFFAAEASEGLPLGLSLEAFVIQLITFVFVFIVLKKFAFKPIVNLLEKRRQTIEDGVRLGEKMEKRAAKIEQEAEAVIREARHDADRIIANAQKESREILREAETNGKKKADALVAEASERIDEEADRAKRSLEKDIVNLVSDATEAVVHEKVSAKKDADLIDRALKGRRK